MHVTLPAGGAPQAIANLSKSCGKYGVIVQSLDSNGKVFVGTDQSGLAGALDANGNPPDGLLVQQSGNITNVPSTIPIVPLVGVLYARNVGAANTSLAVFIFQLE